MNFNFNNQIDFEKELQKKIGMIHDDVDKDLDDLINDDPELRDLIKKSETKKKRTLDEDLELDDLSLEDLESKEGEVKETKDKELDDLLCEEDNQFKLKKEEEIFRKKTSQLEETLRMSTLKGYDTKNNLTEANKTSQIKSYPNDKNIQSKEINPSLLKVSAEVVNNHERTSLTNNANATLSNSELDKEYFDEKVEKFFHSVDKMKSIGVLQKELVLMDYIIKFNIKNNLDYDEFENKKFFIQNQIDKINLLVESGEMDLEEYKSSISKELEFEKFLISKVETEEKIKNKTFVKNRIEKRIDIIQNELNQEIQEEPEDISQPEPKQEVTISTKTTQKNLNPSDTKDIEAKKTIKLVQIIKESNTAEADIINSEIPKEKKIKNKKLYDEILRRVEEYKKGVEYFIKIESLKQAEDARSKVSTLTKALDSLEQGKLVDELDLPIAITPDYICNMTKQERLNNFSIVIKDFSRKKNDINAQVKKAIDGYNKLDPRAQSQIKTQFTESLKAKKTKLDNLTGIINKLMEMVKNPWIPAPLFVEKEEEEKVEKINEDIGDFEILIKIGKLTHGNQSSYLRLIFEVTKDKIITSLVDKKDSSSDFQYSNTFKLEKNEFKYLHRKNFRLILVERSGFCCFKKEVEVGESLIKFDPLKSSSYLDGEFQFKTVESTATDSKISVSVKIRQPTIEKEYINVSKTGISITKTFPPFKGENVAEIIDEEEKPNKINENVKVIKKPEPKVEKQLKPIPKQNIPPKKDGPPKAEIEYNLSDFKQEELENPDIIENLTSVKVLNFKISKVEEEIKKIEGRAPPKIREKLIKMKVTKKNLESQLGGEITINMYLGMLRYQLDHDRKLAKYFQDKKEIEKVKLVAERIPILISEIEEAVDYMTKNKS